MKDSGKRVWKSRELGGARWKEGSWGAVENQLENCVHTKVDIEALERLMGAMKRTGLSEVHPEVLDERRQ